MVEGCDGGPRRPRAAPLPWIPARAGRWKSDEGGDGDGRFANLWVGCVGARGWCQGGGPLSRAGASRTAPTTGVGRTRAGVMRELLVAGGPFDRLRVNGFGRGACVGVWGMRWGTETPPRPPLWIPAFAGMTLVGECGMDERWGRPRASPLPWVPARAGTTMGGVGGCVGARGWCQGGGPLSRAGGSRTAPTTGVGRTRAGVMRELLMAEGPLRVPSGQASTGSGRTDLGGARAVGSGGCDGGRRRPAPRPCPGFPFSRERRWAGWWSARAGGGGGPPSCVLRTGFDRLRANGLGLRACDGVLAGLGSRWGVVVGRRRASGFLVALEVEWGATAVRWV